MTSMVWAGQSQPAGRGAGSPMDFFSRQRAVPDWDQVLIEQQRALVLGVGGLGCSVATSLCRLGIGEVVLVDNDVVSPSNINRQILFSCEDVGRRKTEAARQGLRLHNIGTEISAVHCNAVSEWKKIVEFAKSATVVFNCIDYGEYFDFAVTSLCSSLSLHYISASSYGHSAIAECYPPPDCPRESGPCWACNNTPADTGVLDRVTPDKILQLESLEFLPKDSHMPSTQDVGSSVLVCSMAAALAVGVWLNTLHGYSLPNWSSCDIATFEMFSFPVEANAACLVCKNAPCFSVDVLRVYFGTSEVRLSVEAGETIPYSDGCITNPASPAHIETARRRLSPCSHHGDEYSNCFLPANPTAELEMNPLGEVSKLPVALQRPLLKTAHGTISAIASGSRSAILVSDLACYRLKGCGNYVDKEGLRFPYPGFPLQRMEAKDGVEIRGCCFAHTAKTEQYMCTVISNILSQHGVAIGNQPLGMWRYTPPGEPLPEVGKFAGLFETLGEKRLASHLLPGLEALLHLLVPSITLEQVAAMFPAERVVSSSSGEREVRATWSACCSGSVETRCAPIDMCCVPLLETPPTECPKGIPPALRRAWCQAAFRLRQILPLSEDETLSCGSLTGLLCWALGREVGVVKRVLEANGINWGYFEDHNPFEPHCNAHPNNFIVLPPGSGKLLAPVDFDLSFSRNGFFSPYSGEYDEKLFRSWLSSEHLEMERALAGERANTGLTMAQSTPSSPAYVALSWAFRDTLLCGYRCAYEDHPDTHPLPPRLRSAADSVIRMALILTHSALA